MKDNMKPGSSKTTKYTFLFVLLFILYFASRFLLLAGMVPPIGLEECHTGAAAHEILKHGFQFPIEQYTPEYYETTIIIVSMITVIPEYIFGLIPFSVEIVPFLFSFASLLVCCVLLVKSGFRRGLGFLATFFFFGSGVFVYLTMDSVGSHIIALLFCMIIFYCFYSFCISTRRVYFYLFWLFSGVGAFVHISTLMFFGLGILVYIIHFAADKKFAERLHLSGKQVLTGLLLFVVGYAPNIYFLIKTDFRNVLFISNIFNRRVLEHSEKDIFYKSSIDAFLFQFDGRVWPPVMFAVLFILCGFYVLKLRRRPDRFNSYFLLVTLFISVIPFLIAIVLLSGLEFTSYYIYLMPMLFLMGGAVSSLIIESLASNNMKLDIVLQCCIAAGFSLMLLKPFYHRLNFSLDNSRRIYIADKESAYCYWRFGKAFANYTEYDPDPAINARRIIEKCDRFDTVEKQNECYFGWGTSFSQTNLLDDRAVKVLGERRARLLAMSMGAWEQDLSFCVSGNIPSPYIDDCIVGMIEKRILNARSLPPMVYQNILFPCTHGSLPRYSGLLQKLRNDYNNGSIEDAAARYEVNSNDIRAITAGYCAAMDSNDGYCAEINKNNDYSAYCRMVYDVLTYAREWETGESPLQ